jgi:hypothetical protein
MIEIEVTKLLSEKGKSWETMRHKAKGLTHECMYCICGW